jgi:hypothetical protein
MANGIDWMAVRSGINDKPIGAIGFIDDQIAVIAAFYADEDANKDGTVSWGEWAAAHVSPLSLKGRAVAEVAMAARYDPDILMRDQSIVQISAGIFVDFAVGLIKDAVYAVYFSQAIGKICGGVAGRLADNLVMQYAIRKGMEGRVKSIYNRAVGR